MSTKDHRVRMFVTRFIPHNRYNVQFTPYTDDEMTPEERLRLSLSTVQDVPQYEIVYECALSGEQQVLLRFLRRMEMREDSPPDESHWLGCVREYVDDELEKARPSGDPIAIADLRKPDKRAAFLGILCDAEGVLQSKHSRRIATLDQIARMAVNQLPAAVATP